MGPGPSPSSRTNDSSPRPTANGRCGPGVSHGMPQGEARKAFARAASEVGQEDPWMEDSDNNLGVLSLSTDNGVPTEHVDEMGLRESPRWKVVKPLHEPVGF